MHCLCKALSDDGACPAFCASDCGTELCTNGTCVRRIAAGGACKQGDPGLLEYIWHLQQCPDVINMLPFAEQTPIIPA